MTVESRANYVSLLPWSKRLYAEGKSADEVIQAIYGVTLPQEAYTFARAVSAGLKLPVELMDYPWDLIAAADPSRELSEPAPWAQEQDENAFAQNPDFVPLMQLLAGDAVHDDYIIGYSLQYLRAGNATILGHRGDIPRSGAEFEIVGPSLLDVLHEWMSDHLRMVTSQFKSPMNRGAGSLRDSDVKKVADKLQAIEALQREVTERSKQ